MALLPRHWPVVPTVLVALAVLAMVGLGVWQLQRHEEKQAVIALLRSNLDKGAVAFPKMGPVAPEMLFRRSSFHCLQVESWTSEAGRAADGSSGFRSIAHCSTGAEGPGALVALGVARRPDLRPNWTGGTISGRIVEEPDHRSLLAHLTGPKLVLRPMLVADASPDPQFKAPAPPDVASVPDNHFGYAIQWFLFAVIALVIYVIALRHREGRQGGDS